MIIITIDHAQDKRKAGIVGKYITDLYLIDSCTTCTDVFVGDSSELRVYISFNRVDCTLVKLYQDELG